MLKLKLQSLTRCDVTRFGPTVWGPHTPPPAGCRRGRGLPGGHVGGTCSEELGLGDSVHCLLILPGVAPSKQNSQAITFI